MIVHPRLVWVVDSDRVYTCVIDWWKFNDDGTVDMPDGRKLRWLPFSST